MNIKNLLFASFTAILCYQCQTPDTKFLISNTQVGPLLQTSNSEDLESLFSQDSIVRDSIKNIMGGALRKVSVFEKGGNPLLSLSPSRDTIQSFSNIHVLDKRYTTEKGINLSSSFKEVRDQYTIKKVVSSLNNIVVFLKDSPVYLTIDKSELPENLRYTNKSIEAVQIPDATKIKYLMVAWP